MATTLTLSDGTGREKDYIYLDVIKPLKNGQERVREKWDALVALVILRGLHSLGWWGP